MQASLLLLSASGSLFLSRRILPLVIALCLSRSHNPAHNDHVCSSWGNYHFKTFDGDVYHFPGLCNYVLASDCLSAYEEFNIQIRLCIKMRHNVLFLSRVTLPYSQSGVMIEQINIYTRVTAKIGLTFTWNGNDALMLELGKKYENTTCGLCGDFNGIPGNEFVSNGYHLTPVQFGNLQKLNGPMEHCEDISQDADWDKTCSHFRSECEILLTGKAFSNCNILIDIAPFIESCMQDMCLCSEADTLSFCLCNSMSEFSRQCAHAGGKPGNWRTNGFCEKTCPFNMIYEECGTPCTDTCLNPDRSQMCEEHCIDGCFCPPGTVFDDISNKGCIPVEQCSCIYNGLAFDSGEQYSTNICTGGQWSCTDLSCPGTCSIEGGSHFDTFDGSHYTFHGRCYYVLSKDCENSMFTILGELQPCGITESETCLKAVTLTVQGVRSLHFCVCPLFTDNVTVFRPSNFYIILQANFGLQLQVQLVPLMQLYTILDPSFESRMCGLCGNFNNVLNDDFKAVSGLVEGTASAFANTWKTKASCPDKQDVHENPCSLSYAKHWCSLLLDSDSPFAVCHSLISPDPSILQQCMYDSCNCEKSEDCMCAALSSYVWACAAKGITISNWRTNVCSKYSNCPKTLVYSYDMKPCHRTCWSLSVPDSTCTIDFVPVDGCGCAEGTYMDDTGICVPPASCQCYHQGTTIPPGEVIHEDDAICDWVYFADCADPMVYFDCNNASADSIGTECQKSCQTLDMECYATGCVSGCVCPKGLVSDGSSGCIAVNQCPCVHNGVHYQSGDSIQVDCNTCECNDRQWQCTTNSCHGTCGIYGDGHYITFDGRRYNFNGDCEYTVAQDHCGKNPSNGTFRVITENIPCGTTGTTCSKAIKIFLGNTELKLSEGKYEVVTFDDETHIPYKVRHLGIYLVIEAENGLVLVWDKKTSLTVKLKPSFKGNICGMCGNFDGNVYNDFTTRSQLVVANVQEFGNSWKVSPSCPDVKKITEPCSANTHRAAWAQRQCSIIQSQAFRPCHAQVNPTPYYDACVRDACACDTGGDCECFCTAVAAYSSACSMVGVCVSWRTPDICPLFCDYYNPEDECKWHYAPCGVPCVKTCQNPGGACSKIIPKLEGCYPDCPSDKPLLDEEGMKCVTMEQCSCYINGKHYEPGQIVPTTQNCDIIYHTTDGIGGCIKATCAVNGTINREVYPSAPTTTSTATPTTTSTATPTTTSTATPTTTSTAAPTATSTATPTTTSTHAPTTTKCQPECTWTHWLDATQPQIGEAGGDFETYENIRMEYDLCMNPSDIKCRAQKTPDIAFDDLQQNVQCNVSFGLKCYNRDQIGDSPLCNNYQISVLCCSLDCSTTATPTTTSTVAPTTTSTAAPTTISTATPTITSTVTPTTTSTAAPTTTSTVTPTTTSTATPTTTSTATSTTTSTVTPSITSTATPTTTSTATPTTTSTAASTITSTAVPTTTSTATSTTTSTVTPSITSTATPTTTSTAAPTTTSTSTSSVSITTTSTTEIVTAITTLYSTEITACQKKVFAPTTTSTVNPTTTSTAAPNTTSTATPTTTSTAAPTTTSTATPTTTSTATPTTTSTSNPTTTSTATPTTTSTATPTTTSTAITTTTSTATPTTTSTAAPTTTSTATPTTTSSATPTTTSTATPTTTSTATPTTTSTHAPTTTKC
uniref:Mucin-5AC-like n=1 Tax=Callorhinchus milii TaxID=7868 RepID=A0A4W3H362_CALMI